MKTIAIPLLLGVTACATFSSEEARVTCNAEGLADLVGQTASTQLGSDAMRRAGAVRLRWIRPGDVVTMEFSDQRLNIHLDARNRVESVNCG